MRTTKTLRNLAVAIAIILGMNFIFGNTTILAADVSDDVTSSDEDTAEVEKKLVQYSNDWVILQYDDENGDPTQFDITYMGKTPEELKAEGIEVQYRPLWKDDSEGQLYWYSWYNLDEPISEEEEASDIYYDGPTNFLVEFRAINSNLADQINEENILSISDSFALYDTQAPYIMSSTPYCYEKYDLRILPNLVTFTLKISEQLKQTDDNLSVSASTWVDKYLSNYSASNLSFENYTETYTINETIYTFEYSIITFDVILSPIVYRPNSKQSSFSYFFTFNGLVGLNSNLSPYNFILTVISPTNASIEPEKVNVQSIQIDSPSSDVQAGSSIQLLANVLPEDATDKTVTWSSSNTDYATVDENGCVQTYLAGAGKSVVITAAANDGSNVKATYTLNIKAVPVSVSKITLSGSTSVKAGGKVTLKAKVSPGNADNKSLTWSSSNTKYATVNAKGVVTAKQAGAGKTVTITAKARDGSGKQAAIKIKITKVKVSSIKLKAAKTLKAGRKLTIKATVKPGNATSKALSWTSSNKKYAAVNSRGVVSAKKAGKGKTVTITVRAKDGSGKKAAVKIKIT